MISRQKGLVQLVVIIAVVALVVLGYVSFEVDVNWTTLLHDIQEMGVRGLMSAFWDVVVDFWNTWIAEPVVRFMHNMREGSFQGLRESQIERSTLPEEN